MRVITVKAVTAAEELLSAWGAEVVQDHHNNVGRYCDFRNVKSNMSRPFTVVAEVKISDAPKHETMYMVRNWHTGVYGMALLSELGNLY